MKSAAREAYGSKRVEESIRIHEQGHRAASSDSVEITLTVGCTCATLGVIMTQLLLELRAAVLVPPLVLLLAFLVSTLALLAKLASRDLEHFGQLLFVCASSSFVCSFCSSLWQSANERRGSWKTFRPARSAKWWSCSRPKDILRSSPSRWWPFWPRAKRRLWSS
jgi:hypothetical protein